MNLRRWLFGSHDDILDHVPLPASGDWREQKLQEAALRHQKPFRCGPLDCDREVIVKGEKVTAKGGQTPLHNTKVIPMRSKQ